MSSSSEMETNESCTIIGCFGPYDEYNEFTANQSDDGTLEVEWDLTNGFAGSLLSSSESYSEFQDPVIGGIAPSTATGLAAQFLAPINGEMTLGLNESGSFSILSLNRDPYPSLGVYLYEKGLLKDEVGTFSESYGSIFGPLFGLRFFAPRGEIE